ncbi:uncharacterized protein LOC101845836 isoform X2 [Aplysia californica]|nr:uncharacterized protein LOC101845836 isoform X2 [Aplysia californica]XP_012935894.1 uncharacterized protein LOC101845836 isoform X2 [Aplysia californica]
MATTTKKKKRLNYSEESMIAACDCVSKGMMLREAARTHGVPYPTLRARVNGRSSIRQIDRTVLSREQENRLAEWLTESSRRGFRRTKKQLLSTVQKCLNFNAETTVFKDNMPGEKWYRLFRERHKNKLSQQTPLALGSQRAAVNESKILTWFQKAKKDISQVDLTVLECPERLFNCDESGFQLGGGVRKVLAATTRTDKRVSQVTNDTHKQVTVLVCGNALGELQAPLLIFPGQRFTYNPLEGFEEAHMAKSRNGCIDCEILARWMETAFCPAVAHLQKPVVLFADGNSFHLTLEIHEICRSHGVILYQLPSLNHSSRIVQPLDLTSFKNLKHAWYEEVMKYQEDNSDTLSKQHFAKVFKSAWDRRGHDGDVLVNGFRASGIFPWNPDRFDRTKLAPPRMFQTVQTVDSTVTAETNGPTVTEPTNEPTIIEYEDETTVTEEPIIEVEQTEIIIDQTETAKDTDVGPSAASHDHNMTVQTAFDRLLHLTARAGSSGLVHYMTCYDLDKTTDEPEQQLFSKLYGRIQTQLVTGLTDTNKDKTAHRPTIFYNLPLPARWGRKKRTVIDPPEMVSSDEFNISEENLEKKRRDEEKKKKKRKKIDREEKRLKNIGEKEKRPRV